MGNYLQITLITGPSEASYGSSVTLTAYVKNVWTQDIMYAVATARIDSIEVVPPYGRINVHDTRFFPIKFTMPNKSVIATIFAMFWGTNNQWIEDDRKQVSIKLAGETPPPGISATIESLKVYAEGTAPIYPPLLNVPLGKKVSIKFDAHSAYGSLPYGLWFDASVILKKPVSGGQERYDKSETGPYSTCKLDHFDFSNDWVADEKGTYYATVILRARSSLIGSSVEVARKSNVKVFTVTQTVPPPGEYAGRITSPQVRWGAYNWKSAPQTIEQGQGFSVAFTAYNDSSIALVLKGEYTITYPSKREVYGSMISYLTEIPFIEKTIDIGKSWTPKWDEYGKPNDFTADEAGDYTATFKLSGKKAGESDSAFKELCTPWAGKILTTTEVEPPTNGEEAGFEGYMETIYVDQTGLAGGEQTIPVAGISGKGARVSFHGVVKGVVLHVLCAKVWIYGPAPVIGQQAGITHGPQKYYYEDCATLATMIPAPTLPGYYHPFVFPSATIPPGGSWFQVDQDGQWTIKARLEDESGRLVEERESILFAGATEAPAGIWGIMSSILPLMMIMMVFSMMTPMMKGFEEEAEE